MKKILLYERISKLLYFVFYTWLVFSNVITIGGCVVVFLDIVSITSPSFLFSFLQPFGIVGFIFSVFFAYEVKRQTFYYSTEYLSCIASSFFVILLVSLIISAPMIIISFHLGGFITTLLITLISIFDAHYGCGFKW